MDGSIVEDIQVICAKAPHRSQGSPSGLWFSSQYAKCSSESAIFFASKTLIKMPLDSLQLASRVGLSHDPEYHLEPNIGSLSDRTRIFGTSDLGKGIQADLQQDVTSTRTTINQVLSCVLRAYNSWT